MRLLPGLGTARTAQLPASTPDTVMAHLARAPAALRTGLMPARHQAGGTIGVTTGELRDPSRLQRRLHAGGAPASVSAATNPACQGHPASRTPAQRRALLAPVFQLAQPGVLQRPHHPPPSAAGQERHGD